ncbi:hypothetical protein F4805DRAFT_473450 [Annulohypoxylon moriforme]|nr:hypothetical protein F4805DRAFT_473450 [Annulohypoxylon moriforme]
MSTWGSDDSDDGIPSSENTREFLWSQTLYRVYSPEDGEPLYQPLSELEGKSEKKVAKILASLFSKHPNSTAQDSDGEDQIPAPVIYETSESQDENGNVETRTRLLTTPERRSASPDPEPQWRVRGWPSIGGVVVELIDGNCMETSRVRDSYQKAEDAFCRKLMLFGARYIDEEGRVWAGQCTSQPWILVTIQESGTYDVHCESIYENGL